MCTKPSSKNDPLYCICGLPHSDFTASWEPQPTSLLLPADPLWRCGITVPKSRSSKGSDLPAGHLLQADLQLPWHLTGTVFVPQSFPQKGHPWALSSPFDHFLEGHRKLSTSPPSWQGTPHLHGQKAGTVCGVQPCYQEDKGWEGWCPQSPAVQTQLMVLCSFRAALPSLLLTTETSLIFEESPLKHCCHRNFPLQLPNTKVNPACSFISPS